MLDKPDRCAVVLDLVVQEEHLIQRRQEAEGARENEPDRGKRSCASTRQTGDRHDDHRSDDERRLEDVAQAAVRDAGPAHRRVDPPRTGNRTVGVEDGPPAQLQLLGREDSLHDQPEALLLQVLDAPSPPYEPLADHARPDDRDRTEVEDHGERDQWARQREAERNRDGDGQVRDQRDGACDDSARHLVDGGQNRAQRFGRIAFEPQKLRGMRMPHEQTRDEIRLSGVGCTDRQPEAQYREQAPRDEEGAVIMSRISAVR